MLPVEIKPGIFWIGVNDYRTALFEGLWPISQEGVSYNSYLINDQKKAIIDLANDFSANDLLSRIAEITDYKDLDYLIINHMEPDHSGALHSLLTLAPQLTIYTTERARLMLEAFYGITERIKVIQDGETLSLGTHTLQFYSTPNVHWPETMMTFDVEQGVLFSCDAFGGYGALHGSIFDDTCSDIQFYERESLRYYVNIVSTFSRPVLRAISKLAGLPIQIIAPSHGLIWRKNPLAIVELYQKWAQYAEGPCEKGITLLFGSMYGNTERMMNAVAQGIGSENVPVTIFNVNRTHVSYILPQLWINAGVMVGAPTYEGALFPPMAQVLEIASVKHIVGKKVARFGSYGWKGGGAEAHFKELIEPLKWQASETFDFNGGPTAEDLNKGIEFGARFARLIKE